MFYRTATQLFFVFLYFTTSTTNAASDVATHSPKLVIGTQVRVRTAPSLTAPTAGKLTIGTIVTVVKQTDKKSTIGAKSDYWFQVSEPIAGWVFGGLLSDFHAKQANKAFLALVRDKLGKADRLYDEDENPLSLTFSDALEVGAWAKRVAEQAETPAVQGELALAYWRAMQVALASGTFTSREKAPYTQWIKEQGDRVFYSEPHGMYILRPKLLWDLADRHQQDASGDVIAWQAANAFIGGECEGYIVCVSGRSQLMEGEYLKRFPRGQYVEQALVKVNAVLEYLIQEWQTQQEDTNDIDLTTWSVILESLSVSEPASTARNYLKQLNTLADSK